MGLALGSAIFALLLIAAFAFRGTVLLTLACVLGFLVAGVAVWSAQRDNSARHIAELSLRDSDEKYPMLLNDVQDYAIFMLDPVGTVVSWNAGAEAPEADAFANATATANTPKIALSKLTVRDPDDELREVLSDLVTLLGRKNVMNEIEEKAILQKLCK